MGTVESEMIPTTKFVVTGHKIQLQGGTKGVALLPVAYGLEEKIDFELPDLRTFITENKRTRGMIVGGVYEIGTPEKDTLQGLPGKFLGLLRDEVSRSRLIDEERGHDLERARERTHAAAQKEAASIDDLTIREIADRYVRLPSRSMGRAALLSFASERISTLGRTKK